MPLFSFFSDFIRTLFDDTDAAAVRTTIGVNPRTDPEDWDDFTSGTNSAANIGKLEWHVSGGTATLQASEAGHPGILRRETSTSSGTLARMYTRNTAATGVIDPTDTFDETWVVRLNTNDSDTLVRFGLMNSGDSNPGNDGIYIEKLAADTSWFGVTRASSSETRTAALAAVSTNWVRLRIRRVNASTVGFSIDGGTEVTATATIPTAQLQPAVQLRNASAANKTLDIDFFTHRTSGLTR